MKFSNLVAPTFLASLVLASDVVQLTGETFEDFMSSNDLVLAEFFAPWCGHCKALAPEYEEAATVLKEKGIPLIKVDCDEETSLCADQKIQGYPTLKVFRGAEISSPYTGARKFDSLVSYMTKQSLPAVSEVTAKNIDDLIDSSDVVVVGFFDDKTSNTTFTDIANTFREKYVFGASSDAKLAKEYGISEFPSLVIFKKFDDESAIYNGKEFDKDELTEFIKVESLPVVGEIGPQTFHEYAAANLPLMYIFVEDPEDKKPLVDIVKPLAPKLKGKVNIGTLDAKLYGAHANNVNLKPEYPAVVIHDFESNLKYVHPQDEKITKKSLTKYIDDYLNGKLKPTVKSEDVIPDNEQGPVVITVGKSYETIVLDDDKDVLIEFYAPWCGHCKNLAPIYEELGELVSDNADFKSKVTITKVDHTANDVPDEVKGYPTIKLYPAGKKDSPVAFSGERTLQGLAEFIKAEGTHGVDVLEGREEKQQEETNGEDETENEAKEEIKEETKEQATEEAKDTKAEHEDL